MNTDETNTCCRPLEDSDSLNLAQGEAVEIDVRATGQLTAIVGELILATVGLGFIVLLLTGIARAARWILGY